MPPKRPRNRTGSELRRGDEPEHERVVGELEHEPRLADLLHPGADRARPAWPDQKRRKLSMAEGPQPSWQGPRGSPRHARRRRRSAARTADRRIMSTIASREQAPAVDREVVVRGVEPVSLEVAPDVLGAASVHRPAQLAQRRLVGSRAVGISSTRDPATRSTSADARRRCPRAAGRARASGRPARTKAPPRPRMTALPRSAASSMTTRVRAASRSCADRSAARPRRPPTPRASVAPPGPVRRQRARPRAAARRLGTRSS